jgi:hypothetical protein
VALLRKLLGLVVSFVFFPKPLTPAHAVGAALVLGATAAQALLRRSAPPPPPASAELHRDLRATVPGGGGGGGAAAELEELVPLAGDGGRR